MPMYNGTVAAILNSAIQADNKEDALEAFMEMIKEEYPDADAYEVYNIVEVN